MVRVMRPLVLAACCSVLASCLGSAEPSVVVPQSDSPQTVVDSLSDEQRAATNEMVQRAFDAAAAPSANTRDVTFPLALYDCLAWAYAGRKLAVAKSEGKTLEEATLIARGTSAGQAAEPGGAAGVLGAPGFAPFLAQTVYDELDRAPAFVAAVSMFRICRAEREAVEQATLPGTVLGRLINEGHQVKAAVALLKAHRAANAVVGDDPKLLTGLVPAYMAHLPSSWDFTAPIEQGFVTTSKPLAQPACSQLNQQSSLKPGTVTVESAQFGCVDQPGASYYNRVYFRF